MDVDRATLERSPACCAVAAGPDRMCPPYCLNSAGDALIRDHAEDLAVEAVDKSQPAPQSRTAFSAMVSNTGRRSKAERLITFEHIGGGGLLLQRFAAAR